MRYNTGVQASPTLTGSKLVGVGVGYNSRGAAALVSRGIESGPLAISGLGTLGDDTTGVAPTTDVNTTPSWLTSLANAASSVTNIINQQQLNQINLQRVAAGLQPLPQSVIGPTATVGLSPDTQNLLIFGGIGIAALVLLKAALSR